MTDITLSRTERLKKEILQYLKRGPAPSGRIAFATKANFYEVINSLSELKAMSLVEDFNQGVYKYWRIRK